ncbi:MAG: enoyl-CoA hydratase/isomerase family protein [Actinomycetota bacterium]
MNGITIEIDRVAVITIDRPEVRNAISIDTMDELSSALDDVEQSDASVLVIRGQGDRAFASGGDLKELAKLRTIPEAAAMATHMRTICDRISTMPVPVIAALNGIAYGGGAELAVAADIRVAADDISLAFNQVTLAITPAWGGLERLCALVGPSRALFLATTGTRIDAEHAARWGLVEDIIPRPEFESRWRELADRMARSPRPVLEAIKRTVDSTRLEIGPVAANAAVQRFAATWVAPEHWEAVDRLRGPGS